MYIVRTKTGISLRLALMIPKPPFFGLRCGMSVA